MNQPQSIDPTPQGKPSTMKWLLIILVVVIVLGGGYFLWAKYGGTTSSATTTPTPTATISVATSPLIIPTGISVADWKTYENDYYGFSLKYPKEGTISVDNLNAGTTANGGKRKLTIDVANNQIIVLGDFEGGFEDATYFYQLAIQNSKLNIIKKEKSTSASATGNYITSYVLPITSEKSLYIQYSYPAGQLESALSSYETMISTFQFTK